jgi:hypothetical protein
LYHYSRMRSERYIQTRYELPQAGIAKPCIKCHCLCCCNKDYPFGPDVSGQKCYMWAQFGACRANAISFFTIKLEFVMVRRLNFFDIKHWSKLYRTIWIRWYVSSALLITLLCHRLVKTENKGSNDRTHRPQPSPVKT